MEAAARLIVDSDRLKDEGEHLVGSLPAEVLDLGNDDEICPKSGLFYDIFVQRLDDELFVRGKVWQRIWALCSRCGGDFEWEAREDKLTLSEQIVGENVLIDLTEGLREGIIFALPAYPVCREDCSGLCMRCGKNLNTGSCSCQTAAGFESPWTALDGLK